MEACGIIIMMGICIIIIMMGTYLVIITMSIYLIMVKATFQEINQLMHQIAVVTYQNIIQGVLVGIIQIAPSADTQNIHLQNIQSIFQNTLKIKASRAKDIENIHIRIVLVASQNAL